MNNPIPIIFDFDDSVLPLAGNEVRLPFQNLQEMLRFGCSLKVFNQFEKSLPSLPDNGCYFFGSGDYHHLSLIPLRKLDAKGEEFELVVLDNHPDNMCYPFGIHCGSWVYHASKLKSVKHIHVIGITSSDISLSHAWENCLPPFLSKKLTYWSVGTSAKWLKIFNRGAYNKCFETADELVNAFIERGADKTKIYLSVDKDVFSKDVIKTNWDQGVFEKKHLWQLLKTFSGNLIGMDVTGEVSIYKFQSLFKRFLSGLDQSEITESQQLRKWQTEQRDFNLEILGCVCPLRTGA